jgi:Cyclic nucleotide-binding domain
MLTAAATTVSWIPSESVSGPARMGFEAGVGLHYDNPPPMELTADYLQDRSGYRLTNRLAVWAEARGGQIVDYGYQESSQSDLGTTQVSLGKQKVHLVNVALPDLRSEPNHHGTHVEFTQTAGGRTVVPLPRFVKGGKHFQFVAPIIWTTVSVTIYADNRTEARVSGASAFPRHWLFDGDGRLSAKAGFADFKGWYQSSFGKNTPWHGRDREVLVTSVETALERTLSEQIMRGGQKPRLMRLKANDQLTVQGERGDDLFLVLNGVFAVEVDGNKVAETGPGTLVGERAVLEQGTRTATLRALTSALVAVTSAADIDTEHLIEISRGHHLESETSDIE